jgi:hypothetical protein
MAQAQIGHLYFSDNFDLEKAKQLYKLLKRDLYYETVNLYARAAIAEFETNTLEKDLARFTKIINNIHPESISTFKTWVSSINFRLLPKKVALPNELHNTNNADSRNAFISNLRVSDEYFLEEVNCFTDIPIPLMLLSMLWSVTVGVLLDKKIAKNCLGNRLKLGKNHDFSEYPTNSFEYYLPNYNKWRDQAIKEGLKNLKSGNDILLIALDIKQCFYFLKTDWKEIDEIVDAASITDAEKTFCKKISMLLSVVHSNYFEKVRSYLQITHYQSRGISSPRNIGLPIGLPSSRILANWELSALDRSVLRRLRPVYYGRYVDDLLIVVKNPGRDGLSPSKIIETYFVKTGILTNNTSTPSDKNEVYKIISPRKNAKRYEFLEVQGKKLIFHHYAHEGSWAGLSEFQRELNKQASEFRFLPGKEEFREFMDDAYDINFEGSKNKLRSVIGVKENSVKLSNQLYARQLKYWLGNRKLEKKELDKLQRFYQGRNIFEYARTWEKVLTLFIGTGQLHSCLKYYKDVRNVINKLKPYDDENVSKITAIADSSTILRSRKDAIDYLSISLASALSFESVKKRALFRGKKKSLDTKIFSWARSFRASHMVRHELVRWPLLEYVNSDANLITFDFESSNRNKGWQWDRSLFEYAPRHIHYHEYALLHYLRELLLTKRLIGANQISKEYEGLFRISKSSLQIKGNEETKTNDIILIDRKSRQKRSFCIGVANIDVLEENIKASYRKNSRPVLSLKRQDDLFHVMNEAIRKPKCDLVILPEVSIPYMWLPFMANTSRKNNVGLVFGLEHLVLRNIAYNFVVTILPFQKGNWQENCFISMRVKNHYSPEETLDLQKYGYEIPKSTLYEKFFWRNCWFSVYNCYELTDVTARGLFRSELDLLVSIVWNKDVNYYSNIIESISRDLHLFIAQANTSCYGDSRIVAPKKTEEKDILRVKGGENPVLLKGFIDIEGLRDFQDHSYRPKDERYKPIPAGYEQDKARIRSK